MKQTLSGPVVAVILVVVAAALGFWLYRSLQGASGTAAPSAHVQPPNPLTQKPDFSKMTPEQIEQMKKGGQAAMMRGGGK